MPVARYQLEDGRVARFDVPEGTTPEQAQSIGVDYFASQQTELQPEQAAPQVQAVPQEIDRGFTGASFIEPAAAVASGLLAEPLAGFAGMVGGPEAVKGVRESFTFDPTTPKGKEGLGTLGKLVKFGVDVANIPISGLAGIFELVSGQGLEQAANTIKNVQKEGTGKALGQRTLEETDSPLAATIVETLPTAALSAIGIKKTPKTAAIIDTKRAAEIDTIIKASKAQGVDVLTSDLFPPQTIVGGLQRQLAERVPIAGTGGKRSTQQTQRVNALDAIEQATPKIEAGDIFEGLKASANKVKQAAGKRINSVTESMDTFGTVGTSRTVDAIDSAISKLSRPGKLKNQALVDELNTLKQTLGEADQTFSSLREFRTDARAIVDRVDDKGRSQLRSNDQTLMDSVLRGATDDLDNFVQANSGDIGLNKYKAADKAYAEEARKLTKSRLKNILDKGDVNPELVNNLLFSSDPSQINLLFKNLNTSGRKNARLALMRRALDKSTSGDTLSPEKFVSQLNKLENNFGAFFKGESKAELEGLKRLLQSTKRASEAGVVTPSGQAAQASLATATLGGALVGSPEAISTLILAGTLGAGNRIFESSGVRNLLIQLGKSPKRGTLEVDLLRAIPLLVEKASQGIEQEQQAQSKR